MRIAGMAALALIGMLLPVRAGRAGPIDLQFDLDSDNGHTGTFYTQSAWNQVKATYLYDGTHKYDATNAFGWDSTTGLDSRDRAAPTTGALPYVYRDLQFAAVDRTFKVDLAPGDYTVILYFGDFQWSQQTIKPSVNGNATGSYTGLGPGDIIADGSFNLPVNTRVTEAFAVTVSDSGPYANRVDVLMHNTTATKNWILNGVEIVSVPEPATLAFLAVGGLGASYVAFRRRYRRPAQTSSPPGTPGPPRHS